MKCPTFKAAEIIGKKGIVVLLQAVVSAGNFNAIARKIGGITPKVLSKRLKELEDEGLISKDGLKYILTPKGKDFQAIIDDLKKWSVKYGEPCEYEECFDCPLYSYKS